MNEWFAPARYRLGDHVRWRGVGLVCTRDHYAGDAAEHPWDPGDGWSSQKAATLWAPNGPEQTKRLESLLVTIDGSEGAERLYAVVAEAVGKS